MTDPTNPLHDHLRRAADDAGRPLTTDIGDLLGRAKQRRTRRRAAVAGTVLFTAALVVGASAGIQAALPDDDPAAADEQLSAASPAALGSAELIRRCLPQLGKYDAYPQFAGTSDIPAQEWRVPRQRDYVAGDVVALQHESGGTNPVLCLVPEQGHHEDSVPFSAFEPDASDAVSITELCSEMFLPHTRREIVTGKVEGHPASQNPDLRDATIEAIASDGPVVEALLVKDQQAYSCSLTPITWDAGPRDVQPTSEHGYDVWMSASTVGSAGKSIVDEDATFYNASGTMPDDATSIEFRLSNGSTFTAPVNDGSYAVLHRELGAAGVLDTTYRVLDEQGRVLHEGDAV